MPTQPIPPREVTRRTGRAPEPEPVRGHQAGRRRARAAGPARTTVQGSSEPAIINAIRINRRRTSTTAALRDLARLAVPDVAALSLIDIRSQCGRRGPRIFEDLSADLGLDLAEEAQGFDAG